MFGTAIALGGMPKHEDNFNLRYLEPKTGFLGHNFKSGENKNNSRLIIYVSLLSEMNSETV